MKFYKDLQFLEFSTSPELALDTLGFLHTSSSSPSGYLNLLSTPDLFFPRVSSKSNPAPWPSLISATDSRFWLQRALCAVKLLWSLLLLTVLLKTPVPPVLREAHKVLQDLDVDWLIVSWCSEHKASSYCSVFNLKEMDIVYSRTKQMGNMARYIGCRYLSQLGSKDALIAQM